MMRHMKKAETLVLIIFMILMTLSGCSNSEEIPAETGEVEAPAEETVDTTKTEPFVFSAEDLLNSGLVDGITDIAVLQGSAEIDLLAGITYDESVITNIGIEEGDGLKYDAEGNFEVTYIVTADGEALAAYLQLTEKGGAAMPDNEVVTQVPVHIEIVSAANAADWLAEHPDVQIITDGNEVYNLAAVPEETEADENAADDKADGAQPDENSQTEGTGADNATRTGNAGSDKNNDSGSTGGKQSNNSGKSGSDSGSSDNNSDSGSTGDKQSNNSGKSGSGSGSSDKNNDSGSAGDKQPDTSSKSGSGSGSSDKKDDSGSGSGSNNSAPPAHTHSWEPVYTTVHHDEEGHYETVVVSEAWDEPIYEDRNVCSKCGATFTGDGTDVFLHIEEEHGGGASWSCKPVQVGTKHHDEVTEQRWVVDKAGWDEQVVKGYKCSCGETKAA